MIDSRLWHFIKKEFQQLRRDPRMLTVALIVPAVELFILGYVASVDIKHVSTGVYDQDHTSYSREYVAALKNSGYFDINYYLDDDQAVARLLDSGRAKLVLHFPPDFGRHLARNETAAVQAILDGGNSSSATIILGYLNQINFQSAGRPALFDLPVRVWYNPEMKSANFMVPGVLAMILTIISMLLTAFSIVKEKESGTLEQLIVTPLKPYELILGKLLPFAIVALADIVIVYLVATLWFKVPMHGSFILLFCLGAVFLTTGLGLGVFISTVSRTQRQAMMSALFIIVPSIILSGFIFPIANMPPAIRALTYLIPIRYFLVIVRGIFLKGIGLGYLWPQVWPLILFGAVILTLSVMRFRKKME